jgi:N-acetylglucosaminyl-diphospho-decaprenol L-rhamnosyltransferase
MTPSQLAVVTVTHNSSHVIEGWIDALEETGRRAEMELCVIDSGSTPAERRLLTERVAPRVDAVLERPNLGYGRCCNVGAEQTSAPALLFTNPDTRVRSVPDAVWNESLIGGQVLGAFKQLPGGGVRPLGFRQYPTAAREAEKLVLGRFHHGIDRTADSPGWVSGAALLIKRADFDRIGGFSAELFMYFEDADLCIRHGAAGGSVALHPAFVVEHGSGKSSAAEDPDRLASALDSVSRHSARIFAARHGQPWQRGLLYALLVTAYVPRRTAAVLLGRGGSRRRAGSYALDLLLPSRVMRRLGVPDQPRTRPREDPGTWARARL